jgi:hypothetical protein
MAQSLPRTLVTTLTGEQFCSRLIQTATGAFRGQGLTLPEASSLGRGFAKQFLQDARRGDVSLYSPSLNEAPHDKARSWYAVSDLVLATLGHQGSRVMMIDDSDELRYVSHMMPRSHIILVMSGPSSLTNERRDLVISTMQALGGSLHVIWTGSGTRVKDSRMLMSLAGSTGGVFVDLARLRSCG